MRELPKLQSLSEAVAAPIEKAYRAGGLGLSMLTLGAILMLTAYFIDRGVVSYVLLGTSAVLIFTVLAYFYMSKMSKLEPDQV